MEKHCTIQSQIWTIISDAKEIINDSANNRQISYFYKSLYREKISLSKSIQTLLKTASFIPLSEKQHDSCKGGIAEKEFLKSLKSFQNGMSPRNDSYIEEFYGTLWNDTKKHFLSAVKKANEIQQLTVLCKCKELQN